MSRLGRALRRVGDELYRIRTRLLLVNLVVVAVPLVGLVFARFYEREMLRSLEQDMIHQAEVLRQLLVASADPPRLDGLEPILSAAAKATRTRIRILGPNGELRSDSHAAGPPEGPEPPAPKLLDPGSEARRAPPPLPAEPPAPVDVSGRSEVRAALEGRYGSATRFWENRDTLYLFGALPIGAPPKVAGVVYVTRSTNPVRAAMYRLRTTLLVVLASALGATAVLSVLFAATISRPLARLTRTAERIAKGDRSAELRLERRDEIGQLARAFDRLTRKLDDRARYVGELSANISHEFKSPLTSIRGAAELLLDGAADDPAARVRFLENILADAHRLDRLVTRLLELARYEADPVPTELVDFEALVREAVAQSVGDVEVAVRYRASRTQLCGQRAQLASVLGNLLDNAQQHATEGSTIEVTVSDGPGERVRVTVHNQGPAVSPANLARIWDRFFTTRANEGGTGLGLTIVAKVVEAHGGTVWVDSTEQDGTTFGFELPATKAA